MNIKNLSATLFLSLILFYSCEKETKKTAKDSFQKETIKESPVPLKIKADSDNGGLFFT